MRQLTDLTGPEGAYDETSVGYAIDSHSLRRIAWTPSSVPSADSSSAVAAQVVPMPELNVGGSSSGVVIPAEHGCSPGDGVSWCSKAVAAAASGSVAEASSVLLVTGPVRSGPAGEAIVSLPCFQTRRTAYPSQCRLARTHGPQKGAFSSHFLCNRLQVQHPARDRLA